jgi:hypothetical protein
MQHGSLDALSVLLLTLLNRAKPLTHLTLRPRGHSITQDLSQTPDAIGQARGHGRRPRLPPLDRGRLGNYLELRQGQAQTGVRQYEVVVGLEEGQLLSQPRFVFA